MRQRGRPRVGHIDRFNIDSHLTETKKFFLLRRALGISDKETLVTIVRFWGFVAVNYAFTGVIQENDADAIAAFCWFDGDPKTLLKALVSAGFLDKDGVTVHDWFEHQPLANAIIEDRIRKQKPITTNNFPEFSTENDAKGKEKKGKEILRMLSDAHAHEEKEILRHDEIAIKMAKLVGASESDIADITQKCRSVVANWGAEPLERIYTDLCDAMRRGRPRVPVAFLKGLLNESLKASVSQ